MNPPQSHPDLVRAFLADRDAQCPRCGYNLRGVESDRCPECGAALVLTLHDEDPRTRWDIVAAVAVVMTTLYFGVRALIQIVVLARGVFHGSALASLRAGAAVTLAVDLIMALGGAIWCAAILAKHRLRPRPIWARPTTAAAGLLLAVFVAFMLLYGVRTIL